MEIKMGINIIYVVEIAITLTGMIIGFIKMRKKKPSQLIKFWLMCLLGSIIAFAITFILEKPEIDLTSTNIDIQAKTDERYQVPNVIYHFKNIKDDIKIEGTIDYNKIGDYEITYKIPTMMGEFKQNQTIHIVDTLAPEITLEGEEKYNQSYATEYEEPGYHAIDVYEGDLTDKVETEKVNIDDTNFKIIYKVKDSSGNEGTKIRECTIVDDVPPVIKIIGDSRITLLVGETYTDQGGTATDEKDGDLTANIKTESTVDTSKVGEYTITYRVTDSKQNEGVAIRYISVQNEEVKARNGSDGKPGTIYLTFDDGPSSSITPHILDILAKKEVKATFFVLNYDSTGEKYIKREVAEGHTVGIHGYSHDYKTIYTSVDAFMNNITKLREKIKKSTGYDSTIIRFPGGSSNTVSSFNPGIMTKLCSTVQSKGYKYFDWNVSSGDAGDIKTTEAVYANVTKGLSKSRSNVVLMHDFSGNTKTLHALENIINYGIQNGYAFSNITTSTPMVTHKPNN